jgi:DNA polymerase-1
VFGDVKMREPAKACHHAYNYGAEPPRIAEMAGVPLKVAEEFHAGMKRAFPDVAKWRDEMRQMASDGLMLDNGFGRMMRPDPDRAWTTGPAMPGQGCGRDLMMEGILNLPLDLLRRIRCVVHDEVVLSVRPEDADEVTRVVKDALSFHWVAPGRARGVDVVADLPKNYGTTWGSCYA